MSYHAAMQDACAAVGITVPRTVRPGEWCKSPVIGKARTNGSGRVLIDPDQRGGVAFNWVTNQHQRFRVGGDAINGHAERPRRDYEAERKQQAEREEVARICDKIVRGCTEAPHPYLAAKGFPYEEGLVIDTISPLIPDHQLGQDIAFRFPQGQGPFLIVPGRIGKTVVTVQIITPEGEKKNIYRGKMGGASHRIATGRETWVCEGIATAMSVRAALRLLNRSATVLCAFSAANVAKVASGLRGSIIAADHDKPIEQLSNLGTGEFYAANSGCQWVMPPAMGDFNDMHQSDGLRAVALHLRGIGVG